MILTLGIAYLFCFIFLKKVSPMAFEFVLKKNYDLIYALDRYYVFLSLKKVFFLQTLYLAFLMFVSFLFGSLGLFFILLFGSLFFSKLTFGFFIKKRAKKIEDQLIPFLLSVSTAMEGGYSIEMALEAAIRTSPHPISQEFGYVLKEYRLGQDLQVALKNLSLRVPTQEIQIFSQATLLSIKLGLHLREAILNMVTVLKNRQSIFAKQKSLTSQNKLQSIMASVLPFLVLLATHLFAPSHLDPLFKTTLGRTLLWISGGLLCVGLLIIHRLSNQKVVL